MSQRIIYREFKESDSELLEDYIKRMWKFDSFSDDKSATLIAKIYLLSSLSSQTYNCVAEKNGVPQGIIMIKNNNKLKLNLKYKLKTAYLIFKLLLDSESKKINKVQSTIDRVYKNLLSDTNNKYDGILEFLVVSEESRGLGIGKNLYNKGLEYMKTQNISEFYLYTDTNCNYEFYERQGMTKRGETTVNSISELGEITFFLYDMKCN